MGVIPSSVTTLSVSLIHGHFYAVALHRGAITGRWECPSPVHSPAEFGAAVKQAVEETSFRGGTLHLVLAHPRLTTVLATVPATSGRSLARLLERQAQREKSFDGEAAWCHQLTLSVKGGTSVLLHLFPRALLQQYIKMAEKLGGLTLVSAVPACAVVHGQILGLPVPLNEAILVAAAVGDTTQLVVGQRDGQILLARSVPASWNSNLRGLLADLNRTLLFTKEQFGVEVSGIFLFGKGAEEHLEAVQTPFQIPVRPALADDTPDYWATEVLRLPPGLAPNLVSVEQQKAPQRRALLRVTAGITAVLVLTAMIILGWSHLYLNRMLKEREQFQQQERELQARHQSLRKVYAELLNKRSLCAEVLDNRPEPMPAWCLGYLSAALPDELLLRDFSMTYTGEGWKARMQGVLLPTTNTAPDLLLSSALADFTNRLAQAPLHMRITTMETQDTADRPADQREPLLNSWAKRLRLPATNLLSGVSGGFVIEGTVR
jgi:hypothetical protein